MAISQLPTVELLRQLLDYDRETGKLHWKVRPVDLFVHRGGKKSPEHNAALWNRRWAGREAGTITPLGYRSVSIQFTHFLAHRLIWLLHYGEQPSDFIDHINGDGTDNRIGNLRIASQAVNMKNKKRHRTGQHSDMGVHKAPHSNRWRAVIVSERKFRHLGTFDTYSEALAVRKAAEAEFGFHPNHGRSG